MTRSVGPGAAASPRTVGLRWIAEQLGISERSAARLHQERQIPGLLSFQGHDRLVRYDREAVEGWMRSLIG